MYYINLRNAIICLLSRTAVKVKANIKEAVELYLDTLTMPPIALEEYSSSRPLCDMLSEMDTSHE